jgi:hypothetical protein
MYHDYISRKPKSTKIHYDFIEHKDTLLDIVYKMVQPNAEKVYEPYHIYKELFSDFTCQIVSIEKRLKEKHVVFDISNDFVEDYKEIMIKEKSKSVLELLKNKNIIYENI